MFKSFLSLCALCTVVALTGCDNNKTKSTSMGAVGESNSCAGKSDSCCKDKAGANMGAVGETKSGCCKDKAACPEKSGANMGAMGEKKAGGCCGGDASKCPVSGKTGN